MTHQSLPTAAVLIWDWTRGGFADSACWLYYLPVWPLVCSGTFASPSQAMSLFFPAHTPSLQRPDSIAGLLERRCLKGQINRLQVQRARYHAGVPRAAVGAEDEPEPVDIDLLAKQVHLPTEIALLTQQPCPQVMNANGILCSLCS